MGFVQFRKLTAKIGEPAVIVPAIVSLTAILSLLFFSVISLISAVIGLAILLSVFAINYYLDNRDETPL